MIGDDEFFFFGFEKKILVGLGMSGFVVTVDAFESEVRGFASEPSLQTLHIYGLEEDSNE